MKNKYLFFSGIIITLFISSCEIYNPAEPVPAFIHIQNISVVTDPAVEGSNSSKITDAWVYIDGKLVGAYELPVTLPVLSEGTHSLLVKAGIKVNGIAATRAPYPFYDYYAETVSLTPGQITNITPVVKYVSGLNWSSANIWTEDFEDAGMSLDTSATGSDAAMEHRIITSGTTSPEVFEGTGSGVVYVDHTKPKFEFMTTSSFVLPRGDSPVFLEFNYRSNHQFVVGIFAHGPSGSYQYKVININPSTTWNKIYVYISPNISASPGSTDYTIFYGMLNTSGSDGLYLNLDNIKLIHY
jgi:hypothetical protein